MLAVCRRLSETLQDQWSFRWEAWIADDEPGAGGPKGIKQGNVVDCRCESMQIDSRSANRNCCFGQELLRIAILEKLDLLGEH